MYQKSTNNFKLSEWCCTSHKEKYFTKLNLYEKLDHTKIMIYI